MKEKEEQLMLKEQEAAKKLQDQLEAKEEMIRMTKDEAEKHRLELEKEMMRKHSLENRLALEE